MPTTSIFSWTGSPRVKHRVRRQQFSAWRNPLARRSGLMDDLGLRLVHQEGKTKASTSGTQLQSIVTGWCGTLRFLKLLGQIARQLPALRWRGMARTVRVRVGGGL